MKKISLSIALLAICGCSNSHNSNAPYVEYVEPVGPYYYEDGYYYHNEEYHGEHHEGHNEEHHEGHNGGHHGH